MLPKQKREVVQLDPRLDDRDGTRLEGFVDPERFEIRVAHRAGNEDGVTKYIEVVARRSELSLGRTDGGPAKAFGT